MKTTQYALSLLAAATIAASAQARDMVAPEVAASVRASFPNTRIDLIKLSEFPGMLEITMGKNIAYVAQGLPFILVGHIYDSRTGKDLTAERAANLKQRIEWGSLPLEDAIQRGSGGKKVAVFTDPDCPYCKRLEAELAKLKGVEIHIFMNPVAALHPQAEAKTKAVWCAEDRLKAWDALITGQATIESADCDASAVDRNIALSDTLGFRGTPVLIREDGEVLEGMRPARALAGWLGAPWIESVAEAPAVGAQAAPARGGIAR